MFVLHIIQENNYNRSGLTVEGHLTLLSCLWPTLSAKGQVWWMWHLGWAAEVQMTTSESNQENGKGFSLTLIQVFQIISQLLFLFSDAISMPEQGAAHGGHSSYQNTVLCSLCFLRCLSHCTRWPDALLFLKWLKALFTFLAFLSCGLTHPSSGCGRCSSSSLSRVQGIQKQN